MKLIYRCQKGEPLTIEEMDGNFAHLDERVKKLEANPPLVEGIARVVQEGDQVTLCGTFGTTLGKIMLPKAFPNPRGQWEPGRDYRVLDWVQEKNSVYTCILPHTSTNFETDQQYWALVFHGK